MRWRTPHLAYHMLTLPAGTPLPCPALNRFASTHAHLRAVAVLAAVGHGEHAAPAVLQPAVQLVLELGAPHALAAAARACGVPALRRQSTGDEREMSAAEVTRERSAKQR